MSLVKSLRGVLLEFASCVKLDFKNIEKRNDWLPITRPIFNRFTSGKN